MDESERSLNDFARASIVVKDIKAMFASRMIHESNGDIALISYVHELINGFIEEGSI